MRATLNKRERMHKRIAARYCLKGLRLPRMRGDRPSPLLELPTKSWATPHARGSTFDSEAGESVSMGYPACAGIDPLG